MATVDTIWTQGSEVGDSLLSQGSLFSESGISLDRLRTDLLSLHRPGHALCGIPDGLGARRARRFCSPLAPLFIAMLLFDSTKRFFEAWIAQLANYALVIILVASVANLMLHAVSQPLQIAYNEGGSVTGADALASLGLLRIRVVDPHRRSCRWPPASRAASRYRAATSSAAWCRRGLGTSGRFGRGVFDAASGAYSPATASRLDPLSRKAGQQLGYQSGRAVKAVWRKINPDRIKTELSVNPLTP